MPYLLAIVALIALLPLGLPGTVIWILLFGSVYFLLYPSSPWPAVAVATALATLLASGIIALLGDSILLASLLVPLLPLMHWLDSVLYKNSRKSLWIQNGPSEKELVEQRAPFLIKPGGQKPDSTTEFYRRYLGREKDWRILSAEVCEQTSSYHFCKRSFEVILVLLLLLSTAPLWILIALLIKFSSPGPLLFWQTRTGFKNEEIRIAKFRSMHVLDREARWATDEADRLFFVGSIIRRFHLDELPQLLSVLQGDLSLVGPRPEQSALVPAIEKELPGYSNRHLVRPGLTGWAQVNYGYGGSMEGATRKLEYDIYYIKNQSLWLDFKICLLTPRRILHGG